MRTEAIRCSARATVRPRTRGRQSARPANDSCLASLMLAGTIRQLIAGVGARVGFESRMGDHADVSSLGAGVPLGFDR